jgi:hypothetical protein
VIGLGVAAPFLPGLAPQSHLQILQCYLLTGRYVRLWRGAVDGGFGFFITNITHEARRDEGYSSGSRPRAALAQKSIAEGIDIAFRQDD